MSASSVTEPGTKAQLYIGTEKTECDRTFGALTRRHLSTMKTETQPLNTEFPKSHSRQLLMLHTTTTWSACNGRQMGACQNHSRFFSLEKETFFQTILFALTVIFLLENILSTFPCEGALHHPRAWDRRGTRRDQTALQAPGCLSAGT